MVRLSSQFRPLFPYLKPAYTYATRLVAPASLLASQLRGGYLPRGVVDSMEQAAATTNGRCLLARPEEVVVRTRPLGFPPDNPIFEENLSETIPRVAVAELPSGRVLSPHSAVITGAGALVHELSIYFGTHRPLEHPLFLHPFPPPPLEVPGRLGVLSMQGEVNYYHFLHDVIPRIGVLEQCPDIEPPPIWYVPAATSFQRELLDLMGIGPEVRIDSTEVRHVRAECLVVPGPPSMTVRNPPWVGEFLRSRLRPLGVVLRPERKVYITRGSSVSNRSVSNEAAVRDVLQRRGFEVLDPATMTVTDQIAAFAEASCVVAPHGAALANLVFANPGSTVIELFPAGCIVPDFWKMACGVPGLEYRYLMGLGDPTPRGRSQLLVRNIVVDTGALSRMLDDLEAGSS